MKFQAKISEDSRIHIPKKFIHLIKNNDLAKASIRINGKKYVGFARICKRKDRKYEYTALLRNHPTPKNAYANINLHEISHLKKKPYLGEFYVANIFDVCGLLGKNRALVLHENSFPLVTSRKFSPEKLAFYMGCYFSDGTKRSTYWRINASTFEQANYYIKNHKTLVKKLNLQFMLTFRGNKSAALSAAKRWEQECEIVIPKNKIKVIPILGHPLKWNKFGSLSMVKAYKIKDYWKDLGKPEDIPALEEFIKSLSSK